MELSLKNLEQALRILAGVLDLRKASGFWLVVCGGSALLARRIISRPTHDVDILALRGWDGEVGGAFPLPEALKEAAEEVAEELGLDANWLNSSASLHFPDLRLLPRAFWLDLQTRDYGERLKVSFVSRRGQIQLKTYAALNRAEPRDLDDLHALAPTSGEIEMSLRWVLDHMPGLSCREKLPEILTHLGHALLIPKFQG